MEVAMAALLFAEEDGGYMQIVATVGGFEGMTGLQSAGGKFTAKLGGGHASILGEEKTNRRGTV